MRLLLLGLMMVPVISSSMEQTKAQQELRYAYSKLRSGKNMDLENCLRGRAHFIEQIKKVEELEEINACSLNASFYKEIYRNDILPGLEFARARAYLLKVMGKDHARKLVAQTPLDQNCFTENVLERLNSPLSNTMFIMSEAQIVVTLLEQLEEKIRKKAGL